MEDMLIHRGHGERSLTPYQEGDAPSLCPSSVAAGMRSYARRSYGVRLRGHRRFRKGKGDRIGLCLKSEGLLSTFVEVKVVVRAVSAKA